MWDPSLLRVSRRGIWQRLTVLALSAESDTSSRGKRSSFWRVCVCVCVCCMWCVLCVWCVCVVCMWCVLCVMYVWCICGVCSVCCVLCVCGKVCGSCVCLCQNTYSSTTRPQISCILSFVSTFYLYTVGDFTSVSIPTLVLCTPFTTEEKRGQSLSSKEKRRTKPSKTLV